ILRGDPARNCEDWRWSGRKFRGDDSERVGLAINYLGGTTLAGEGIRERLLKGSFTNESRGHPYARRAGSFQHFDACRYLKRAPTVGRCGLRKQALSLSEREACRHNARRLQKTATVHDQYLCTRILLNSLLTDNVHPTQSVYNTRIWYRLRLSFA